MCRVDEKNVFLLGVNFMTEGLYIKKSVSHQTMTFTIYNSHYHSNNITLGCLLT